jgi:tetratricopeptide (TPR) repeat protein
MRRFLLMSLLMASTVAAEGPHSMSDPDGQELLFEELSVRTAIHGMLSLTELEYRFRNPQDRRIDGRFSCTLPPNAAISRFAKEVNGQLMEGEVVERLRANQVYEQYLHVTMRDPALLEQDQGNRFSARIFPIEPRQQIRLILSYTQLLPLKDGIRTYALPLRGLPKVNKLSFRAFVTPLAGEESRGKLTTTTAEVTSFDERDWTPDRDIVLTWRAADDAPRTRVLRAGDFYLAALRPRLAASQRSAPAGYRFYVDTSASSAEGATHRVRAIEQVLSALPAETPVQLLAFDNEVVPLASGTASQLSRRVGELLRARLFLGGTDLGAVVADATRAVGEDPSRAIVIVSDLVPTLGHTNVAALPATATVHALILGSREDAPTAKKLTAGRGRVIRVPFTESLDAAARAAAKELRRPLGGSIDVRDAAAKWIYPAHFDDVADGEEIFVLGKLEAGQEPQIAGVTATRLEAATFAPLLEREAYRAYLERLAEREATEPEEGVRRALAAEQVRVSIEQRVVIPRTTMLVLESEWDYQRFGLNRRALAAILTVEAGGIGRVDRGTFVPPPMPPSPPPPPPVPMPRPERRDQPKAAPVPVPPSPPAAPPAEVVPPQDLVPEAAPAPLRRVEGDVREQAVTVTAQAPAIGPELAPLVPPPPPPPPPRSLDSARDDKRRRVNWWKDRERAPRARIAELDKQLKTDPRNRALYNQLSEMLTAYREWSALRALALRWQPYDPENPQVYEVLGIAAEQLGDNGEAARAFASLIEIAPAKTELLQRAGLLLLRAHRAKLAEAPLRKALEVRPDRANGYRHLALMLWQDGRVEEAARVLESALGQNFPGWYGNVKRVISEELGYIYRAWLAKDPSRNAEISERAQRHGVDLTRTDALRVTLAWETDANDVDLHVVDPSGEECYYSRKLVRSGLTLYEDITQGLGPEVIRAKDVQRGTYHVGVRYFNAGPMGVSRGLVVVLRGDGRAPEIHPFRLVQGGGDIRYVAAVTVN